MKKINKSHTTSLAQQKRLEREKRRLKAAKLFAQGEKQSVVAKKFRVSSAAVSQWHKIWKKKNVKGLASKGKPGPKSQLTASKLKKVEVALLKGPMSFGYTTDIWTLKRIKKVVKQTADITYHESYIWKILTYALGWTSQKPETRAAERNEKAIANWKRHAWPSIKKKQEKQEQF
jgi:transposase